MTKISTGGGSGEPSTERNWRSKSDQIQSAWIGVPALSTFYPRGVGGACFSERKSKIFFTLFENHQNCAVARCGTRRNQTGCGCEQRRVEGRSEKGGRKE
jgi:hypothetical protein